MLPLLILPVILLLNIVFNVPQSVPYSFRSNSPHLTFKIDQIFRLCEGFTDPSFLTHRRYMAHRHKVDLQSFCGSIYLLEGNLRKADVSIFFDFSNARSFRRTTTLYSCSFPQSRTCKAKTWYLLGEYKLHFKEKQEGKTEPAN